MIRVNNRKVVLAFLAEITNQVVAGCQVFGAGVA
jgi:hypothetical protein